MLKQYLRYPVEMDKGVAAAQTVPADRFPAQD